MKPQDNNVMNTLARGYTEFEAFKRLFLNPSAGLKHFVKMSADIVSMGPKIFVESMPDVAGYVTRKVYNMTPNTVKNALSTIGIKSEKFSRIERSLRENDWPVRPSGLCRFCPAKHLCEFTT